MMIVDKPIYFWLVFNHLTLSMVIGKYFIEKFPTVFAFVDRNLLCSEFFRFYVEYIKIIQIKILFFVILVPLISYFFFYVYNFIQRHLHFVFTING